MNTREAFAALVEGKRIRVDCPGAKPWPKFEELSGDDFELLRSSTAEWAIVEEPATDEELVAEMEQLASEAYDIGVRFTYLLCARMLRERRTVVEQP